MMLHRYNKPLILAFLLLGLQIWVHEGAVFAAQPRKKKPNLSHDKHLKPATQVKPATQEEKQNFLNCVKQQKDKFDGQAYQTITSTLLLDEKNQQITVQWLNDQCKSLIESFKKNLIIHPKETKPNKALAIAGDNQIAESVFRKYFSWLNNPQRNRAIPSRPKNKSSAIKAPSPQAPNDQQAIGKKTNHEQQGTQPPTPAPRSFWEKFFEKLQILSIEAQSLAQLWWSQPTKPKLIQATATILGLWICYQGLEYLRN